MDEKLLKKWSDQAAAAELADLTAADRAPMLLGLPDAAKAVAVAELYRSGEQPLLVLTANMDAANLWQQNLSALLPGTEVLVFPRLALLPFEVCAHNIELAANRLRVLSALAAGGRPLVIAPIGATVRKLVPQQIFAESHLTLARGDDFPIGELAARLVDMGYSRETMVDQSGTFAMRGGIIDIFPITAKKPVRIEFFDTEIDSMRYFDPETQCSAEPFKGELRLTPVREIPLDQTRLERGLAELRSELNATLKGLPPDARRNLRGKINPFLEQLAEGIWQDGMDHFFYHFYPDGVSFYDYLPSTGLICIDEPGKTYEALGQLVAERQVYYNDLLPAGQILPGFAENFLDDAGVVAALNGRRHFGFALLADRNPIVFRDQISPGMREIPGYVGQTELFADDMQSWQSQGYTVFFCASSQVRANNMKELLADYNVRSAQIGVLALTRGFEYPAGKLAVVTESELLGRSAKAGKRRLTKSSKGMDAFVDLKTGDLVVHANHGIGRFRGIERITVDGIARDYLHIDYAGSDRLFVPIDQMDLVQKYIGNEGTNPKLYKLGGNQWQKVKSKVRASVADMADELLKLYAERQQAAGFAFSPDTSWQREFEDAFEYEETEGQLSALEDIKRDMESSRPMDRLLCGDVGYGKTEVAMRAAFKAVADSKQVAMLVPTTLLAEQHYLTFRERFAGYPIKIASISRFVPLKRQRQIMEDVLAGRIDILIGTHRLLSKDIAFKDLGLLVIDEEQRFGVAHKEKLKQWRKNVDVLTLSATPIPRTLHMSLVGMRDMSVITTPPPDRHPVQTYVVEYNDLLIRDAVEREIARHGQVYFIHNRVMDIMAVASQLQALVPNAKVLVAHGQMTERELEKVMTSFVAGEGDVLLCTTIAESGLDIPNVNTLIVHEADFFGLSQLYQLRGRVGRSPRQAYAYFTYGRDRIISEDAKKRLVAIRDFSQLGSGFKIAMRDMEIRGAGNILGSEQHGHIAAVGFEMYCKLVAEEVEAGINQTPPEPEREALQLELGINAFIPDVYLADTEMKVEIYKRIAAISGAEDKSRLMAEINDRFGKMPPAVENLFAIGEIKSLANQLLIKSVQHRGRMIVLNFFADHRLEGKHLVTLVDRYGKLIAFSQQKGFAINLAIGNLPERERVAVLTAFLQDLLKLQNEG